MIRAILENPNMIKLILVLFSVANANNLCDEKNSVDLTEAGVHDGIYVEDGVRFPPDYVYTRNISGEVKNYGCLCDSKKCFRKCCPLGEVFLKRNGTKSCIKGYDVIQVNGLNVSFMDTFKRTVKVVDEEFSLMYGIPCDGDVYMEQNMWAVQENYNPYFTDVKERQTNLQF